MLVLVCFSSFLQAQPTGRGKQLDKAIDKAMDYLSNPNTEIDLQSLFLYQYVQRKFDLPKISDESLQDKISEQHTFYPFLRLVPGVNPKVDSTIFAKVKSDIDRLTLRSIYCDMYDVLPSISDSLLEASKKGKYTLTHALWSIQLLEEQGCFKRLNNANQTKKAVVDKVVSLVENAGFKDDIAIEAMCFLYGIGKASLIRPEWINIMVSHQATDGGFFRTPKNSLTNSKTTILALWCMLEFKTGGKKKEHWIR